MSIEAKIIFVDRTDVMELGIIYDLKDMAGNSINDVAENSWGEGETIQMWDVGEIDVSGNDFTDNDPKLALFSPDNPLASLALEQRIENYSDIGRRMDHAQPEKAIELI